MADFDLGSAIADAAGRYGLDPDLFQRLVQKESGGRAAAVSRAGAIGLTQLMPGTARDLGVDPHDPVQNLDGGARYLRQMIDEFDGDVHLGLAAYNAGPERVKRAGGIPKIAETQRYVRAIAGRQPARPGDTSSKLPSSGELESLFDDGPAADAPPPPAPAAATRGSSGPVEIDINEGHILRPGEPDPNEMEGLFADQPIKAPEPSAYDQAVQNAKAQHGQTDGRLRAGLDGFTFGLADEARAAGHATGQFIDNVKDRMAGRKPKLGAAEAFRASMQADRELSADYASKHPVQNTLATVAGSVVNPATWAGGEFIAGGRTLGAAALRSAAVGAAEGGAYGAGAGEGGVGGRAISAVAGAGGGAIFGAAAPPLAKVGGQVVRAAAGRYAPELLAKADPAAAQAAAASAARELGVEIADLPAEHQQAIQRWIAQGHDPRDAVVKVVSEGLPEPVPLSQGQVTGDPSRQLQENIALRGGRGQAAAERARTFRSDQTAALNTNAQRIATDIAGGDLPPVRGQAGEAVSGDLSARRDAAKAGVDAAYDAARAAPEVRLPRYDADALTGRVRQALADFDPENVPRVQRELTMLTARGLAKNGPTVANLFASRARLSTLRMSADPVEGKAAGDAVKAFDGFMGDALDDALFHGDPAAVEAWRTAISKRREFGQIFQGGDLIQKLTERAPRSGEMQLRVDPGDATNYILGRSGLGFVGKRNLTRDLGRLRDVLGADSSSWNELRAEAFQRFAGIGQQRSTEGGQQQFTGAAMLKAWNKATADEPELMGVLFDAKERATIGRYAAVAARATSPVRGGDNPSNTAITTKALSALSRLPFVSAAAAPMLASIHPMMAAAAPVAGMVARGVAGGSGRAVAAGVPRRVGSAVGRLGGGFSAGAGAEGGRTVRDAASALLLPPADYAGGNALADRPKPAPLPPPRSRRNALVAVP